MNSIKLDNSKLIYFYLIGVPALFALIILMFATNAPAPEISMLEIINATIGSVILNFCYFLVLLLFVVFVPGRLLKTFWIKNRFLAYFSSFTILFIVLFIRQQINFEIDTFILLVYSAFTIIWIYLLLQKRDKISFKTSTNNKYLTTGILLFFISFSYWLFVNPPYYDELYRAQYIVRSMFYAGNENILFYLGGENSNYYILLEIMVGQLSQLFSINYKITYFIFFPATSIITLFFVAGNVLKTLKTKIDSRFFIYIPFLFIALIAFYWQASVHFFLRQTINGFLFFILTLNIYRYYINSKALKEKIIIAVLFGWSLFFTFYSKGMFGYAAFPVILVMELLRINKGSCSKEKIPLFFSILIVIWTVTQFFKINGEGLSFEFQPLFNFINASPHNRDFLFPRLSSLFSISNSILLIVFYFLLAHALRFNVQNIFILKDIYREIKKFVKHGFRLSPYNSFFETGLLLISVATFMVYNLFTISKNSDTGGADNYFMMLMIFSTSLYTIFQIAKLRNTVKYGLVTIIFMVALLPIRYNFSSGAMGSLTDKNLLEALKVLEEEEKGLIVHNIYDSKQSLSVSSLTHHSQYMGFKGYGGVKNQPKKTLNKRIRHIEKIMDNPKYIPTSLKEFNHYYVLKKTNNSHLKPKKSSEIFRNENYSIFKINPQNE